MQQLFDMLFRSVQCFLHKGWPGWLCKMKTPMIRAKNWLCIPKMDPTTERLLEFFAGNEAITLAFFGESCCFDGEFLGDPFFGVTTHC
jgi:hypothetical protein